MTSYVHGYSARENLRLVDQANTLTDLLHANTRYTDGSRVLEVGCGVGAQTVILATNSPQARFTSIDISPTSLHAAAQVVAEHGLSNVRLHHANLFALPFAPASFDHVFLCFVLEHLENPLAALQHLQPVLKPGGTITVIEGDNGSPLFSPPSPFAAHVIQCLTDVQARMDGNALIGRQLYPLLTAAGYTNIQVSPRFVYVDAGKPEWVEGFTRNTFIPMIEGVKDQALDWKLIDEAAWDKGIADLYATTNDKGVFCYTFFKATAVCAHP